MSTTFADPADDECIHGLPPTSCTICLHGVTRHVPVTVEATFPAKYGGECRECGEPIEVDEIICRMSNDRYLHQECVSR